MQIDRQLLAAISKGDEKTIFQLYRYCYNDLSKVCRRYATNEDEVGSMLNMGFLKIVKNIGQYRTEVPFEAWIRKIMINTAIDHYRKNRKYKDTMVYPAEDKSISNYAGWLDYNEAEMHFDAEQLLQMIRQLPPVSQTVFNLYAIDGYSHKEVAEILEISEGTSKWHLATARKKLQELLIRERNLKQITPVKSETTGN